MMLCRPPQQLPPQQECSVVILPDAAVIPIFLNFMTPARGPAKWGHPSSVLAHHI